MIIQVPGAPPQDIQIVALNSRTVKVDWFPPPSEKHHGQVIYYRILYKPIDELNTSFDSVTLEKVYPLNNASQNMPYSTTIDNLEKWTQYRVQLLAGTKIGDGPLSEPIIVRTDEDGMMS